jgi:tRNA G37 N-methylase Trm5
VDGVRRIDANDLDDTAAAAVRQNLELNDSKAAGLVRPIHGDVRMAALRVRSSKTSLPFLHCWSHCSTLLLHILHYSSCTVATHHSAHTVIPALSLSAKSSAQKCSSFCWEGQGHVFLTNRAHDRA